MLTLTLALWVAGVLSHDSFSLAAAWIAEGVGNRYSNELARMMLRSYGNHCKSA